MNPPSVSRPARMRALGIVYSEVLDRVVGQFCDGIHVSEHATRRPFVDVLAFGFERELQVLISLHAVFEDCGKWHFAHRHDRALERRGRHAYERCDCVGLIFLPIDLVVETVVQVTIHAPAGADLVFRDDERNKLPYPLQPLTTAPVLSRSQVLYYLEQLRNALRARAAPHEPFSSPLPTCLHTPRITAPAPSTRL